MLIFKMGKLNSFKSVKLSNLYHFFTLNYRKTAMPCCFKVSHSILTLGINSRVMFGQVDVDICTVDTYRCRYIQMQIHIDVDTVYLDTVDVNTSGCRCRYMHCRY